MKLPNLGDHQTYCARAAPAQVCAPKYLGGTMSLGEVAQAAAAFVSVQTALNWVVGNYQHLAEWTASVDVVTPAGRL